MPSFLFYVLFMPSYVFSSYFHFSLNWRQFSMFELWWISSHSSFKNSWLMWIMWITLLVICTFREHLVNQDLVDWQELKDQWSVDILLKCGTIHTICWVPQSIRFSKWFCQSTSFKNSSCNVSLVDCILCEPQLMNCTLQRSFTITGQ